MTEKVFKGLLLAVVFGGVAYLVSGRDFGVAAMMAFVMFMSMFISKKR